jgi:pyruvate/2-oxoglutarate dehydrogenase complex dihydrolipoamide acyltransferase (E2) component
MNNIRRIGSYSYKTFSKARRNIVLITDEALSKRATHSLLEIDVTKSLRILNDIKVKKKLNISFTGWIIKCVTQTLVEYKLFNAYRHGKRKILYFNDVDVAITVEKKIHDEIRPLATIIRRANEKTVLEITDEIRKAQKEKVKTSTQVLGQKLSVLEKITIYGPEFIQKLILAIVRRNAKLKKKYLGTTAVTAIGMKGKLPGWVIPLGGIASTLFVVGGINKKPGIIDNKIEIREYINITMTSDHDLIDGGPLVRFIQRFTELLENGYALKDLLE